MDWESDSYADEDDLERRPRAVGVPGGWRRGVGRALAYTAVVAGVVALAAGAVFAVNVAGLAAKPGGFGAPDGNGPKVAGPPAATPREQVAQPDDGAEEPEALAPASNSAELPVAWSAQDWTAHVAAASGIPARALTAYASAQLELAELQPECGLGWTTLAAIGAIESGHGSHGDAVLGNDGYPSRAIVGPALDGTRFAAIADTDGGRFDGDAVWDRAVGPMQFIPSTWAKWGSDANGDGVADPNQIDDAALGAARYLCASGSMKSPEGWRAAVFSYNHVDAYVDQVATLANEFAAASRLEY